MFITIFISAWTVMHAYVFWRLSSIPFIHNHLSRPYVFLVAAICWVALFGWRFLDSRGWESTAAWLERFSLNWLGVLFLLFCCFLAVDLVTVFGVAFRQHVYTARTVALAAGVLLALTAFVQAHRAPVVNDYEIKLANLPRDEDGLRIAAISDLHVGRVLDGPWLAARIEQIQALHPDLVVIVGDLFEGDEEWEDREKLIPLFKSIAAQYGVYAVTGNHDPHRSGDRLASFLQSAGVKLLHNEWVQLTPGLALGGVDDGGHSDTLNSAERRVRQTLAAKPMTGATIFLYHRPQLVNLVASAGVGLMLSGHTHSGQIWPFSYVVQLINPLLEGKYVIDGMPLIISRGAGTWGPRMRLWQRGEIVVITLRA